MHLLRKVLSLGDTEPFLTRKPAFLSIENRILVHTDCYAQIFPWALLSRFSHENQRF